MASRLHYGPASDPDNNDPGRKETTMKTLAKTLTLMIGLSLGLAACGSSGGSACDDLNKKLCSGKDKAYCEKTHAWLTKEMVGPDDEKLSSDEANMACKMIAGDKDALAAYQMKSASDLAK